MNHLTTDLIEALAQKQDIEEVFRHHLETAINQLLKHELTVFLDYEPYDREGFHSGNSRNGFYDRTFKTEYGELHLRIPRRPVKNYTFYPSKMQTKTRIFLGFP